MSVREYLFTDSETFPIKPGRQAPRVVCGQTRFRGRDFLESREVYLDRIEAALADPSIVFVGHNIAFDVLCSIASRPRLLVPWLDAYKADRVTCTYEREKLARIAQGTLSRYQVHGLEDLVSRYKIPNPYDPGVKGGPVRTGYHAFDGLDPALYPENFRAYALADLVVSEVFAAQDAKFPAAWFVDQYRQARAALWLAATSAHGMRVDPSAVAVLSALIEEEHQTVRELLTYTDRARVLAYAETKGIPAADVDALPPPVPLVRPVGSRDMKAARARMIAVSKAQGLPIQLTDKGKEILAETGAVNPEEYPSLNADACLAVLDPVLMAFARFGSINTLRARVHRLEIAARLGLPIQPRFDTLKETGRTSASAGEIEPDEPLRSIGDQTQNLPREPGLRECYRARPGCLILSSDWKAAELHALAQACIDLGLESNLARILNDGTDVHLWFACIMRGWSYAWATSKDRTPGEKKEIKAARQGAKACMFGFPGGLGVEKFRLFAAKQYQVRLTDAQARENKGLWFEAFPEMPRYFQHIDRIVKSGEPLVHFKSMRYRGGVRYTSAANSYFQGRVGDMLKDAGFRLQDRIWREGLPARTWNQAHDEILVEFQADRHDIPVWVVETMESVGRDWCPDCPPKAEPALQIHWRKGAEPAYRDGVLVPHEHREIDLSDPVFRKKTKEILDSSKEEIHKSWILGVEVDRLPELRRLAA